MKKINLIEAQRELRKNAKKDQAWSEKDQVGTKLSSKEAGVLKLEGGSDEHPMSTRSASDGERWKNRGWKYVACMLMVLVLSIGQMWADTTWDMKDVPTSSPKKLSGLTYWASGSDSDYPTKESDNQTFPTGETGTYYVNSGGSSNFQKDAQGAWVSSHPHRVFSFTVAANDSIIVYWRGNSSGARHLYVSYDASTTNRDASTAFASSGYGSGTQNVRLAGKASSAGTVYVWGDGSIRIYKIQIKSAAVSCSTPTAPTALAASSITSSGATLTVTDAADANKYEFYISESSTTPTTEDPTHSVDGGKEKVVSDLDAGTTYYAWVRAVCDESHKSSWVAMTSPATGKFTTLAAPTATFENSTYAIGGSALDLSSLFSSNSEGAVTYSVDDAAGTGATVSTAAFSATRAGKAKVKAVQAANGDYGAITKYAYITVGSNTTGKHTVTFDLEVNVNKSRIPITDSVRSTSLYLTTAEADTLKGTGVTYSGGQKSGLTGKISAPDSYDGNKYVYVQFTIADGYTFTPDSAWCIVQPVSEAGTAKLVLSDNNSHTITGGEIACAKGSNVHSYVKNGSSVTLTGTVTLKIYCYGSSTGTYRLGEKINIHGSLAEDASGYTVTYDANGGTGTMTDSDSPYEAGATVTVLENEFTKPGYAFDGWSAVDASENVIDVSSSSFTMPSSNVTITAQWVALVDTFKDFEHGSEDGHGGSSGLTRSGANRTTPNFTDFTPVNEYCNDLHYHFIGWVLSTSVNDNGTLKNDAVIVPGGQGSWNCTGATYYAVWAAENE